MNSTQEVSTKSNTCTMRPYYSSSESEQAYELKVYMPGVSRENATIRLENGELLINGAKSNAPQGEGWRELSRESCRMNYELRLGLNVEIDGSKIEAKTENGVLTIKLPKAESLKPRKIQIQ